MHTNPRAVSAVPFRAACAPERRRAMNSGSLNISATGSCTAMLKSPHMKSTSSRSMCTSNRWRSEVAASRFLATMCKFIEQNESVFGSTNLSSAQVPGYDQRCEAPRGRSRVSLRRVPPAFHCRSDNLYFSWRWSFVGFDKEPSNSGFGFPNVVSGCTRCGGIGNRSHTVNVACVGSSGVGGPAVPVVACCGGVVLVHRLRKYRHSQTV